VNSLEVAGDLFLLLAALGVALAVDYADVPLLGQSAFLAVGGFGTVILATNGVPLLAAVVVVVVIAAVMGYLLGLGAVRLHGGPLALATWAFAWLVQSVLENFPRVSGGDQGRSLDLPVRLVSPTLGVSVTLTTTLLAICGAALVIVVLAALWRIEGGPIGLDLAALRGGRVLASTLGVPSGRRRRHVLAVAAALGALGGAGNTIVIGTIAPADVTPVIGLELLVAVLLGAGVRPWGTLVGFALVAAMPHATDAIADAAGAPGARVRAAGTAILFVVALLLRQPTRRIVSDLRRSRQRPSPQPSAASLPLHPDAAHGDTVVRARGIRVTYGAIAALDGVDLELRAGEVHALVGPNGSGKTTLLRVLAGTSTVTAGLVEIGTRQSPGDEAVRVAAGVVRTPQRTYVPGDLRPHVQASIGASRASSQRLLGLRHLLATPTSRPTSTERAARATAALRLVGAPTETVTDGGDQRLVQVARAVATGARTLLLDEPAAGLTVDERDRLGAAVRSLAESGAAVCLVEHDMRFVTAVADRVTVLDAGRVLASGSPSEIRADPAVRRVYLGDET